MIKFFKEFTGSWTQNVWFSLLLFVLLAFEHFTHFFEHIIR